MIVVEAARSISIVPVSYNTERFCGSVRADWR